MRKFNVVALLIGLSLALVTTSAFRSNVDTLYGLDGSTWVSIEGYTEDNPNDLDPGEYACILEEPVDCTAKMDSPTDTSPQEVTEGQFIYEPAE